MDIEDLAFPMRSGSGPRHRLEPDRLIETARQLSADINDRLPGSSLADLARDLATLAAATVNRARSAREPILAARVISALATGAGLLAIGLLASHYRARWSIGTINELVVTIGAGTNLLILSAGAVWTCLTLEVRLKRRVTLGFIEELREFVHVIDLAQLYYTPDLYRSRQGAGPLRPAIDETYLLDCTRMLAVIGNLTPLYTRGAAGDSIMRAAAEVEMLAVAITTKHLAKAEAVRQMGRVSARRDTPAD